jgi:hypothetical protein
MRILLILMAAVLAGGIGFTANGCTSDDVQKAPTQDATVQADTTDTADTTDVVDTTDVPDTATEE